ncbi:MAG TPA: hypothetical protein DHU63_05900 [Candidatus Marinimicrobia bacterium]|nr:MAG: hypothetical protein COY19_08305 [Candidatus Marinimicrobia bacterium CG_4_10_14_0_2_um_filter_48_9]HCW76057.1 hypothetical protein [Candidatus Neomarinimicrobiota bacterium]
MNFPSWRTYLDESRSYYYSLFLILPLAAMYEVGTMYLFSNQPYELRNAADALLRFILEQIGVAPGYYFSIIFVGILTVVLGFGIWREKRQPLNAMIFPMILLESLGWGTVLFFALQFIANLTLTIPTNHTGLVQVNLALGAGIYEELVFRVILIAALSFILRRGFHWQDASANWTSLLGAAVIFAGFHLFAEVFQWHIFIQRITGGILLGALFLKRGYGVSAYSHIFYNLIILISFN